MLRNDSSNKTKKWNFSVTFASKTFFLLSRKIPLNRNSISPTFRGCKTFGRISILPTIENYWATKLAIFVHNFINGELTFYRMGSWSTLWCEFHELGCLGQSQIRPNVTEPIRFKLKWIWVKTFQKQIPPMRTVFGNTAGFFLNSPSKKVLFFPCYGKSL